jgi:NTE family protein
MPQRQLKVGIALDSGGAMGGAHIGVLEVLAENKIPIDIIVGSSAGAAVGAFFAAGKLDTFKQLITDLSFIASLSYYADPVFPTSGLLAGNRARRFLQGIVGEILIEDLPLTYIAVATDLLTGETVPINNGLLSDAVMASISMPGIFRPVVHMGRLLSDGGVSDPLPLDVLRSYSPDITIACNLHTKVPARFSSAKRRNIIRREQTVQESEEDLALGIIERLTNLVEPRKIMESVSPRATEWINKLNLPGTISEIEFDALKTLRDQLALSREKLNVLFRKNLPKKSEGNTLNIFEILASATNIQQYQKNRLMLRYEPPDVLIEPDVMSIGSLEFTKGSLTIEEGRSKALEAVPKIKELLKKKKQKVISREGD